MKAPASTRAELGDVTAADVRRLAGLVGPAKVAARATRKAARAAGLPVTRAGGSRVGLDELKRLFMLYEPPPLPPRPVVDSGDAEVAAQWAQLSEEGLARLSAADPPRYLPPGFGERRGDGRRQYALGDRGRLMFLGDGWFGDDVAIANEVWAAMPVVGGVVRETFVAAVVDRLRTLGSRVVAQRMLEGGFVVEVPVDGVKTLVTVSLDLGDALGWRYVPGAVAQQKAVDQPVMANRDLPGQRHYQAIEADHEHSAGSRIEGSSSNTFEASVNVLLPFAPNPLKLGSVSVGVALGASAGGRSRMDRNWSRRRNGTWRWREISAYFEFPRGLLRVVVGDGLDAPSGEVELPALVGFPKELAPLMGKVAGSVLLARPLSMGEPLGVVRGADRLVGGGDRGPELGRERGVGKVLRSFLFVPESVPGLDVLRRRVQAAFPAGSAVFGSELYEGIQDWISEKSLLTYAKDLISSMGMQSPRYTSADGNYFAYLTVKATMLNAQPVSRDPVPLKEEAQRWASINTTWTESGSISLTLPSVRLNWTIGDPTAKFGFNHSAGLSIGVSSDTSTARPTGGFIGGGEVRGLTYTGDSVRYRTTMAVVVTVETDLDIADEQLATDDVEYNLRLVQHDAARFEAAIQKAMTETAEEDDIVKPDVVKPDVELDVVEPDVVELDDVEPDVSVGTLTAAYPPESMAAEEGIGFARVEWAETAEDVMPAIKKALDKVEFVRAWVPEWTVEEWAYFRGLLASRYGPEALINHAAVLFRPGGLKFKTYRPIPTGTEVITVTVTAAREQGAGEVRADR